ncbi:M24 family metallopeptidase, partial [Bacillus cereus]
KGIIIIEAGANGGNDLDQFRDRNGKQVLNRNSPDFKDSGAIIEHELKTKGIHKMSFDTMVLAGANSALPHGIPGANKMKRG